MYWGEKAIKNESYNTVTYTNLNRHKDFIFYKESHNITFTSNTFEWMSWGEG